MEYRLINCGDDEYSYGAKPFISISHFESSLLSEVVSLESMSSFPFVCRYETQDYHKIELNESSIVIDLSHVDLVNLFNKNDVITTIRATLKMNSFLRQLFRIEDTSDSKDAFIFCTLRNGSFVGRVTVSSPGVPMIVVNNISSSIWYAYSIPIAPGSHDFLRKKNCGFLECASEFAIYFNNSDTRFAISKDG